MMTVREMSRRTGVSIRTLQYYDQIGLLKATAYTQAGYRLYDDTALEQMQQILLFRELEFPLKDIRKILSNPHYDRRSALEQQIRLLEMRKAHIENLIVLARGISATGEGNMDFSAFDKTKMKDYANEAKKKWGSTSAYQEFEDKRKARSEDAEEALGKGLMEIFRELGQLRDTAPEEDEAQALVKKLQNYISRHYYTCTRQILLGLGEMYADGGEFTENIDAASGAGTAQFANAAIRVFCKD